MKSNMGAFDGWFRTLLFVVSICYAVLATTALSFILAGVTAVFFGSAVLMWCPLYAMFGLNTNPTGKAH